MSDKAGFWPIKIRINKSINTKVPPPSSSGYVKPKNPDKAKKRVLAPGGRGETGWLDKKGNVWVPDIDMDGGEGWRRHYPNGEHDHVYPNGKVRSHKIETSYSPYLTNPATYYTAVGISIWMSFQMINKSALAH